MGGVDSLRSAWNATYAISLTHAT